MSVFDAASGLKQGSVNYYFDLSRKLSNHKKNKMSFKYSPTNLFLNEYDYSNWFNSFTTT